MARGVVTGSSTRRRTTVSWRRSALRCWPARRSTRHDRVLDVGCGTGTTARAAAAVASSVLGVDLSPLLVERARTRAQGVPNVEFQRRRCPDRGAAVDVRRDREPVRGDVLRGPAGRVREPAPRARARRGPPRRGVLAGPRAQRLDARPGRGARARDPGRGPGGARPAGPVLARGPRPDPLGPHRFGVGRGDARRAWTARSCSAPVAPSTTSWRSSGAARSAAPRWAGCLPTWSSAALDEVRDAMARFVTLEGVALPGSAWLVRAASPATG